MHQKISNYLFLEKTLYSWKSVDVQSSLKRGRGELKEELSVHFQKRMELINWISEGFFLQLDVYKAVLCCFHHTELT